MLREIILVCYAPCPCGPGPGDRRKAMANLIRQVRPFIGTEKDYRIVSSDTPTASDFATALTRGLEIGDFERYPCLDQASSPAADRRAMEALMVNNDVYGLLIVVDARFIERFANLLSAELFNGRRCSSVQLSPGQGLIIASDGSVIL